MKHKYFLENAKFLNEKFNIIPLLYGSLGLEVLTGTDLYSDDIDILIPKEYIFDKWNTFNDTLINAGYKLIDLHEHTFIKDNIKFSYADIESLEAFAGIKLNDISNNGTYKLLNLKQYLMVYNSSLKDGYRQKKKNKKDMEKIIFIKSQMQ